MKETLSKPLKVYKVPTFGMTGKFLMGDTALEEFDYYTVQCESDLLILSRDFKKVERVPLSFTPKFVVQDKRTSSLLIVNEETLDFVTYNLRSRQIGQRQRRAVDLYRMLKIDVFVDSIIQKHAAFQSENANFLAYDTIDSSLLTEQRLLKGKGLPNHAVLSYLMQSIKCPLQYSPRSCVQDGYNVQLYSLLEHKQLLKESKSNPDQIPKVLSLVLSVLIDQDCRQFSDTESSEGVSHQSVSICNSP